ncbi:FMN-binding negative transcriptional regulator [soil metagenome]
MTVYVPAHFANDERALAVKAIREQNFAILISTGADGEPFVTHCPLVIDDAGSTIVGHLARANGHWKLWHDQARALAVFPGAHAYISPTWYQSPLSVPTWNYVAVHASGIIRIVESREAREAALEQLIAVHEPSWLPHWQSQADDFRGKLLDAIVAFEIDVDRIDAKYKLSQNRPAIDRETVAARLDAQHDDAKAVARWMREIVAHA